ncbi:hypothetical protein [Desnuesiella massiliensis]|uniref:hypothetical protein n=1 Tax=Desnuesiella massiliensis TaxID=1650662 RepID=UPI001FA7EDC9|nr:hypothetical protein [Desnuesiella massiliensis]
MKLMEEYCGNGKDNLIALATIALSPNAVGNPSPAVRMVDAYYEDGVFYVSTDANKNKMLEIGKNNEISICELDLFVAQGTAENLGWVKDERNAEIRAKMKKSSHGSMHMAAKITLTQSFCVSPLRKER